MKTIITLLILLFLIAIPTKIFANERNKNPDQKLPFSQIIDWREEGQRQKYDELLAEKYKIESYPILYFSQGEVIKDPWYRNEQFKIISDSKGIIKGYILSFENITIPILFYKQKSDDDKPVLTYARTNDFEIIANTNGKKIKLNSFDVSSLTWCEKIIGNAIGYEVKENRGIFKEVPQKGYNYCQSTTEMLNFLENHFEALKGSWRQYVYDGSLRIDRGDRLERYEKIKSQIRTEVKKYGGNNWEKITRDIQKKWPAMK